MSKITCPRRVEVQATVTQNEDEYQKREGRDYESCSYCGSMNPDEFMQLIRDKKALVGPTDKTYKAYVLAPNGNDHLGKFYYQHLSMPQRKEFVDMLNNKQVGIGYPFHLYVLPFFTHRVATQESIVDE